MSNPILVDPTGFEPVTSALQMQCSSQLSYRPVTKVFIFKNLELLCPKRARRVAFHSAEWILNNKVLEVKPLPGYIHFL